MARGGCRCDDQQFGAWSWRQELASVEARLLSSLPWRSSTTPPAPLPVMEVTLFYYSACMQSTKFGDRCLHYNLGMATRMRPCRIHFGWCVYAAMSDACRLKNLMVPWKKTNPPKNRLFGPNFTFRVPKSHKSEWVKNGDFIYYLMRLIATWGASCRHDSTSPKTGAWPSLVVMPVYHNHHRNYRHHNHDYHNWIKTFHGCQQSLVPASAQRQQEDLQTWSRWQRWGPPHLPGDQN